tara:strand:+ start:12185 stop:14473 length:2289 start_codon:yes stop_codon:yes gene_type:complete
MSIFSSVATGADTRRDLRRGQRQQMAEAFAQYKRNNPLATVADFQSFIDSFSGGDNYIAGGAPGESVLRRIEANNRAREAERQKALAFKRYQERRAIEKDLMPEIQNYLIDLKKTPDLRGNPVYNFTQATDDFLEMRPELKDLGINFNAMMTNEAREQAIAERVNQNLQLGENYFKTLPLGDEGDFDAFQQVANLPDAVAQQVFNNIQKTKSREYQNLINQTVQEAQNYALDVVSKNPSMDEQSLEALVKKRFQNVDKGIYDKIFSDETNDTGGVSWLDQIELDLVEAQDKAKEIELANANANLLTTVNQEGVSKAVAAVAFSQGKDKAKQYILDNFKPLIPEYLRKGKDKNALDTLLDNVLNTVIGISETTQDQNKLNIEQQIKTSTKEAVTQAKQSNIEKAKDVWNNTNLGKINAGELSNFVLVAEQLGSDWVMDNRTINLLVGWAQTNGEALQGISPQELKNAATGFLAEQGARPWVDEETRITDLQSSLVPLERMTFENYIDKEVGNAVNDFETSINEAINTVIKPLDNQDASISEIKTALNKLKYLKQQFPTKVDDFTTTIANHKSTQLNWRDIDGKLWSDDDVNTAIKSITDGSLASEIDKFIGIVDDRLEKAEALNKSSSGNERSETDTRTLYEQEKDAMVAKLQFNQNKPIYKGIKIDAMDWNIIGGNTWKDLTSNQSVIQKGIEDFFRSDVPRDIWQKLGLNANLDGVAFNYQDFVDTPIDWILTNEKAKEMAKEIWGERRYNQIQNAYIAEQ